MQTFNGASNPCMFVVMPGNYYKITGTALQSWNEYLFNTGTISASGDLVGSKALSTNYQNTGSGFRIVEVVISGASSGANISVFSDTTTTPTTLVGEMSTLSSTMSIFFIVPQSYYYKVTVSSGSIAHWNEYTSSIGAVVSGNLFASNQRQMTETSSTPPAVYSSLNISSKCKFVSIIYTDGSTGTSHLYSDSLCPPLNAVWVMALSGGLPRGMLALQMPNEFIAAWQDSGSISASTAWYEYTLG